jgi:PKHD-type hydroxylase
MRSLIQQMPLMFPLEVRSCLSEPEIDKIVSGFETYPEKVENGLIGIGADARQNQDVRRVKILFLDYDFMIKEKIAESISNLIAQVEQLNRESFMFDITDAETLQVLKYTENDQGFYRRHFDCEAEPTAMCRKLTFIVSLSHPEDYDGGYLKIDADTNDTDIVMPKGNVMIFPSFLMHQVTPVTRGTRYSLVGWLRGPTFK